MRIFSQFKQILTDTLINSTVHAIPNIIRSEHKSLKIMWLIFFTISTGLCSFLVIEAILDYLNFDVNTEIRNIYDGNETPFPTITICNKNMFTSAYAYEFLRNITRENDLTDLFNSSTLIDKLNLTEHRKQIENLLAIANARTTNLSKSEKKKLSYLLESILFECQFNYLVCSSHEFIWLFDKLLGNCYKFNTGYDSSGSPVKLRKSIKSGMFYGLSLTLFAGQYNKLNNINSDFGLILKIDNSSYSVLSSMDSYGITLGTGFEYNIGIDRFYTIQLPEPYSNCDSDDAISNSEWFNILHKNHGVYRRNDCIALCYQAKLTKYCNCTPDYLSEDGTGFARCKTIDEYKCATNFYFNNYSQENFIAHNCYPKCPIECNKTDYKVSITFSQILPEIYSSHFRRFSKNVSLYDANETVTLETVKNSLVRLNIYYNTLSYTIITENESITLVSLLSNIGGSIGLFLGSSLLSIVELVEIFIKFLIFLNKFKSNSKLKQIDIEVN